MNNDLVICETSIFVSAHYPFLRAAPTSTATGSSSKAKASLLIPSL